MTKEGNRLTARFYQLLFFFFIFFASLFFFSFLAPQVSPSSAFSGRCKDWRDQSSPAGFGERRNQDTDCSRSLFLLWTLRFPQPEDHPPPIHCQCPRPTPPRFPLPAAMSLQPSCTSQQANQRFDASMTCRERWTETTGTLPLMGGQPSSSLFPLIRLAQSGMILEFQATHVSPPLRAGGTARRWSSLRKAAVSQQTGQASRKCRYRPSLRGRTPTGFRWLAPAAGLLSGLSLPQATLMPAAAAKYFTPVCGCCAPMEP